jgi:hypothetical protein
MNPRDGDRLFSHYVLRSPVETERYAHVSGTRGVYIKQPSAFKYIFEIHSLGD